MNIPSYLFHEHFPAVTHFSPSLFVQCWLLIVNQRVHKCNFGAPGMIVELFIILAEGEGKEEIVAAPHPLPRLTVPSPNPPQAEWR